MANNGNEQSKATSANGNGNNNVVIIAGASLGIVALVVIGVIVVYAGVDVGSAIQLLVGVGTLLGVLAAIVSARDASSEARKGKAEARAARAEAAEGKAEAKAVREQVAAARTELAEANAAVEATRKQLVATDTKLGKVAEQVDGITKERVIREGERAGAVATLAERDRNEDVAAGLKIVTDAALAEAQAAPSNLPGPTPPEMTTTGGALNVNVINRDPVKVDVVEKPEKEK